MKFSKYNIIVKDDNGQRYLFNTFSGSCFSVDAEEAAAIEGKDISLLNEDTIEQFSMSGVLIKDELDEDSFFRTITVSKSTTKDTSQPLFSSHGRVT